MTYLLSADIGGTKTLLQLSSADGEVIVQQRYDSPCYPGFEQILTQFMEELGGSYAIEVACLAVAGPVSGRAAQVTNLPWRLNADELSHLFGLEKVLLCNDFAAVGYGIEGLREQDLLTLQAGEPGDGPRAVIGAGTGLGQAILVEQDHGWQVLATEGGHVDFAPTDRMQLRLLEHLFERSGYYVSYERLLSGKGLVTIYNFLRDYRQIDENPELRIAMVNDDAAAAISDFAAQQQDPLAVEALDMFFAIYGAQAGNLALSVLSNQGLYIAGGIAGKNIDKFSDGTFMQAFLAKGQMRTVLEKIPVRVILQPEIGLTGARLLAQKAMYN